MSRTVFENARLVDPAGALDRMGRLVIEDGRIADLGGDLAVPEDAERIDCGGHVLAPGFVDLRSFAVDAPAALAGGVTSVVLMPDQSPPLDSPAMIESAAAPQPTGRSPRAWPMGAASQGLAGLGMAELGLMREAGAVGFSDGRRAIADASLMRRLLEYAQLFDALLVQHAEEPALAANGAMNEGATATRLGLPGIPAAAETIMIERDARLAALTGGPVHFAQVSTRESLAAIERLKSAGLPVTCGVAPQHFTLNESAVGEYRTFAKVAPPLREEADRAAVAEAVAGGLVDVICSGHEPRDQDAKRQPFSEAAPGIVGYETLLPLCLMLHREHDMALSAVLALVTCKPADLLGLELGRLQIGRPADLVVFDPDRPWRVEPEALHSQTQNTPFENMPVQGRVLRSVVAGRTVYREAAA